MEQGGRVDYILLGGRHFTNCSVGGMAYKEKNGSHEIYGFVKIRDQKDPRAMNSMKKEVNLMEDKGKY